MVNFISCAHQGQKDIECHSKVEECWQEQEAMMGKTWLQNFSRNSDQISAISIWTFLVKHNLRKPTVRTECSSIVMTLTLKHVYTLMYFGQICCIYSTYVWCVYVSIYIVQFLPSLMVFCKILLKSSEISGALIYDLFIPTRFHKRIRQRAGLDYKITLFTW